MRAVTSTATPIVLRVTRLFARHWLLLPVLVAGLASAVLTHDLSFDFVDNSTFYALARSLAQGEHIYEDVIHFRTPGSFWLWAAFVRMLGDSYQTVMLAIRIESYVLFPVCLYVFGVTVLRTRWIAVAAATFVLLLPPFGSMRVGASMLALAAYVRARRTGDGRWAVVTGTALAGAFIFSQEIAALAVLTVLAELATSREVPADRLKVLRRLAVGTVLVAVPFVVYIGVFSSLSVFLFQVFYFAFFVQQRGMGIPFPSLSVAHLGFYQPLLLYPTFLASLLMTRTFGTGAFVLLTFGTLRFVSVLGRSDSAHLFFSIPELFLILPATLVAIWRLWRAVLRDGQRFRTAEVFAVVGFAGAVVAVEVLALDRSLVLLGVVPVYMGARSLFRPEEAIEVPAWVHPAAAVLSSLVFAAAFSGTVQDSIGALRRGLGPSDAPELEGVQATAAELHRASAGEQAIEQLGVENLFALPNEAYFYTLGVRRPTPYLYLEPAMTDTEKRRLLADLRREPPDAVFLNPEVAGEITDFSGILDHLTTHYQVDRQVMVEPPLWILVPKEEPSIERHLAFRVRAMNPPGEGVEPFVLEDFGDAWLLGIHQVGGTAASFPLEVQRPAVLRLRALASLRSLHPTCGIVQIRGRAGAHEDRVCSTSGVVTVPLGRWSGDDSAVLTLRAEGSGVSWLDPTIRGGPSESGRPPSSTSAHKTNVVPPKPAVGRVVPRGTPSRDVRRSSRW